MSAQNGLVQRLWSYCNILRDDGLSYGDYLEQLTFLLFLKMADEQTRPPFDGEAIVPEGLDWPSLLARDGDELEAHYIHVLRELGLRGGMLGVVFRKAQNRIQDPAKLRRLIVDLIDRESWLDPDQKRHLRFDALRGWEIVDATARLCVMNLLLHGIGSEEADSPIRVDDALKADPGDRFDMVLTNPPFGKKSSMTFVTDEGEVGREDLVVVRDDFWTRTSNKQLNFVQHVRTLLRVGGRAAVVVPDNVLFEGGAGETVRRKLLEECDVHTLLRLPTGVFYAQGVKANVLFFDRKPASEQAATRELWVYDLRTNQHFTLKQNPLRAEHLEDFVACFAAREETERFKRFTYEELLARDKVSLDLVWLRDESLEDLENLPPPDVIAQEIVDDLEAALAEFSAVAESLGEEPSP